jgi:uncharacterized protein
MSDIESSQSLGADVCWSLLRSTDIGRLALVASGRPEIFPVNFVVDHGTVVFRTAEGTKLAAVTINHEVAFEVDGVDREAGEAWSVVVKGRATELNRFDDLLAADDLPIRPLHASPKNRYVRIVPDEISGRRFVTAPPAQWDTPLTGTRRVPHE